MLTKELIQQILGRLPHLRIGVIGDLFLDRYLDIDGGLNEPSVETGLTAYQVTKVRSYPGAAGTVINNFIALGVGHVAVLAVVGQDGEGYELRRELELRSVDLQFLIESAERYTPTYTKPMLHEPGVPARELNRLDIKNRSALPVELETQVLNRLPTLFRAVDALLVLDQVGEPDCGVVTSKVREKLAELGAAEPAKMILADSRKRIGEFRNVWLKPNQQECEEAVRRPGLTIEECVCVLAKQAGRPVFCTRGARGILIADAFQSGQPLLIEVPACPLSGPLDIVGAGDSTSAGIASAYAAGASLAEAAAFGNLIASITIQQIGTTGTASPEQVWERWQQLQTMSEPEA